VRFAFIKDHRAAWPVAVQCRVLAVSRAGFYAWLDRPAESPRAAARRGLTDAIRAAHVECRGVYGSPRMTVELAGRGGPMACENTVARAMADAGIAARRRRRFVPRTTDSAHANPVAPNVLNRDFAADLPDRKWAADITYVPTGDGWLYVAAVMDLCSRRVVGWAMADHLRAELCLDALAMALDARRPGAGLLHHSDRGAQYTCGDYRAALAVAGVSCSMSRTGDCWDNAAMESFWATLKRELVDGRDYATHAEARASIFEYIEVFYNRTRRHSALGYVSPEQFEAALN
jgi:transposase InsO family protein